MVSSSARLFICIAPSPTNAMTGRSGWAYLAPIAYGTAAPLVARVPASDPRPPARNFRSRAYQLAAEPESEVTIALSGRRGFSSQNNSIGLIGSAPHGAPLSLNHPPPA